MYPKPFLHFQERISCTVLNAVVDIPLHEKELENVKYVSCITILNFLKKCYTEIRNILRTFSSLDRPKNKNVQPRFKN